MFVSLFLFAFLTKGKINENNYHPPTRGQVTTYCEELVNGAVFENKAGSESSVTQITQYRYNRCPKVAGTLAIKISVPVRQYAFYACEAITSVEFVDTISIAEGAFAECPNLAKVIFPSTFSTTVTFSAFSFYSCSNLTIQNFPSKFAFDENCFAKCSSLEVTLKKSGFSEASFTKIPKGAFYQTKVSIETTSIGGTDYVDINFPVEESAFEGCSEIKKLYIQGSLSTSAFENCENLNEVYLKVSSVSSRTFCNCIQLTKLHFDQDIKTTSIYDHAFQNTNIQTLNNLPKELSTIEEFAFQNALKTSTNKIDIILEKITSISESAFQGCTAIKSITANQLNSIEPYVFQGCTSLESITTNQLQYVGDYAFQGCTSLTGNLYILQDATYIGKYAFASTAFNNIKVKFIGPVDHNGNQMETVQLEEGAFSGLSKALETVEIEGPSSKVTFGKNVFHKAARTITNLNLISCTVADDSFRGDTITNLKIDKSTIGENSFREATITSAEIIQTTLGANSFVSSTIRILTVKSSEDASSADSQIGGYAFDKANIGSIDLTFVDIQANAFRGINNQNTPLTLNYLEGKKYNIGSRAFYNTGVSGPNNFRDDIITIGEEAFAFCSRLGKSGLTINAQYVEDGAFRDTGYSGTLTLGDNVNGIASSDSSYQTESTVFQGCQFSKVDISDDCGISFIPKSAFKKTSIGGAVNIPKSVQDIGDEAFYKTPITSVTINGEKITSIPSHCFYKCDKLTSVTLPPTIVTINQYAFTGCADLKYITLPQCLTTINQFAFAECKKLQGISLPSQLNQIGNGAFQNCMGLTGDLKIPNLQNGFGHHAFYNCGFDGSLELDESITTIPKYAFYRCQFKSADLSDVQNINEYAFNGCNQLNKVTFYSPKDGAGVQNQYGTIGNNAFQGTAIGGPLTLTYFSSIGDQAFAGCSQLSGVNFGDYITQIPTKAFQSCGNLQTLSLNHVSEIKDQAFSGCTGIRVVNFGDSLTAIPDKAFYNCAGLQGPLSFPETLETIGDYAFYQCIGLQGSVTFPQSVGAIGDYAFYGCTGLNGNLIFNFDSTNPGTNTEIGKYAFYGCTELTGELNLSSGFQEIKEHAFEGLSKLTGPLDLTNVQAIGDYAFAGCTGFNDLLKIHAAPPNNGYLTIGRGAFKGCTGFKDGTLSIFITEDEENQHSNKYYEMSYFLRIEDEAFDETKFKTVYYSGRFEPDCTKDTGLKKISKFKSYNYYANKSFCGKTVKKSLSGGAIAGIVIACIVVVAAIVVLVVFLILRKKNDQSENEVEMNNSP